MKGFERNNYDVRKITVVGNSRGITLPEEWIESKYYKLIKDGNRIILEPIRQEVKAMKTLERATGVVYRKVNKIGNSLAINIPKEWLKSEWYKVWRDGNRIILEPVK